MSASDPAASSAPPAPPRPPRPPAFRGHPYLVTLGVLVALVLVRALAHRGPAGGEPVQHLAVLRVPGHRVLAGVRCGRALRLLPGGLRRAGGVHGGLGHRQRPSLRARGRRRGAGVPRWWRWRSACWSGGRATPLLRHRHAGPGRGAAAGLPPLDGVHGSAARSPTSPPCRCSAGRFQAPTATSGPSGCCSACSACCWSSGNLLERSPVVREAIAAATTSRPLVAASAGLPVVRIRTSLLVLGCAIAGAAGRRARPLARVGGERAVRRRPRPGHLPDADPRRDAVEVRGAARRLVLRVRRERAA